MLRIALNGYGRIGRALLRALFERGLESQLHVEAINEIGDFATLAHLTRFDTTFGRFSGQVELHEDILQVNERPIRLVSEKDFSRLPWQQLAMSRMRAVEHDRTVLVAATSGISAIITPDGRMVRRSREFTPDIQVATVPVRTSATINDRLGGLPEWLPALAGIIGVGVAVRARRRAAPDTLEG